MKKIRSNMLPLLMGAGLILSAVPACVVPPFSELQDARMVGQGGVELTPFYSSIHSSANGHVQDDFGVQGIVGLASWAEMGFRYEYIHVPGSGYDAGTDVHVFAAGPKFSLIKDRIALALPVGFGTGQDVNMSETWEFHPAVLFTLPLAKIIDLNASAKVLIPFQKDRNTLYAMNIGLGIRPGGGAWIFRPETGILFNPNGDGFYFHLSLGISARFGK